VPLQGQDELFVLELLSLHPSAADKIGIGVKYIEVRPGAYNTLGFYVTRVDGSGTDFSYRNCLGLKKPGSWTEVSSDFREAVRDQTFAVRDSAFARAAALTCPVTGETFDAMSSAVDHIAPDTFDVLLRQFFAIENLDWRQAPLEASRDNQWFKRITDEDLRQRWRAFHAGRAKLRVISRRGNLQVARWPARSV
jgi:hypothetical protein